MILYLNNLITSIKNNKRNPLVKGVSFLLGGTVITQLITLALAPILTRLYSPEDYGINSLYISTISILGVFATLRFNAAIVIAQKNIDRLKLTRLSIFTNLVLTVFLFFVIGVGFSVLDLDGYEWIWFVPLSTFLLGMYEVKYATILNENNFKNLAKITVVKIASQGVLQIFFALIGLGYLGLILGNVFSILLGTIFLSDIKIFIKHIVSIVDIRQIKDTFKKFIDYPKFAFPAEIASISAVMIFPFLISSIYSVEEVGYFALANKLIAIPISLFGNSVRQVFIRDIGPIANDYELMKRKFIKTAILLLGIGIPIAFFLYFFSPVFFAYVFGDNWVISGYYVQSLVLLLVARLTVTPLLSILNVINQQKYSLIINSGLLIIMLIATFTIKSYFQLQAQSYLFSLSIILFMVYFASFILVLSLLKRTKP